jgi:MoaA/NifB/PqqE/SkfB family radical SAM enzyme
MSISQLSRDLQDRILDGTKIQWYLDRVRAWDREEHIAPVTIDMALTTTCNLACKFCVAPATKILMADFTWKAIKDVVEGDMVIGFDEHKPKGTYAQYYPTKVTAVMKRKGARLHRLINKSTKDYLFITNEHPVLCNGHRWRPPSRFRAERIRFFTSPYETDFRDCYEYKLGYLKGALEGDGTFGRYKCNGYDVHKCKLQTDDLEIPDRCEAFLKDLFGNVAHRPKDRRIVTVNSKEAVNQLRDSIAWKAVWMPTKEMARGYLAGIFDTEGSLSTVLRISQLENVNSGVCKNIVRALELWGYKFVKEPKGYRIQGGYAEISRFLGQTKPAVQRKIAKLYKGSIPGTLAVTHDTRANDLWVHNIETESHTYVANGFAVHNCYATLQHNTKYKITKEHMTAFLDDAAEIGVKGVSLVSDGESSISPAYEHTITYGHSKGLAMASGTNAYLLSGGLLRRVLPCLTYLRVNISGGTEKGYCKIMGAKPKHYYQVLANIADMVSLKEQGYHDCTIGMQMVFKPDYESEVLPLAKLAVSLGVDYLQIKHCSDDEFNTLGVKYGDYEKCYPTLQEAERLSTSKTLIKVKWSKIQECSAQGAIRSYQRCYGPPFLLQISGTGLIAPCGMLFNERYAKDYHMGNITQQRFKDVWKSDAYWNVIRRLASDKFNAQRMCGSLCLQHSVNKFLDKYKKGELTLESQAPTEDLPLHGKFV